MAEVVAIIKRESCSFKSVLQILLFCHLILCGYFMFFALHPMSKEEFILNWFSAGEDVERSWVFRNLFYIVQNKFYFLWMHAAMILVVLGAFKKKIPQYLDVWIAYSLLQCGSAIGFLVVGLYNSNFTWPWKQLGVLIIIYIITVLMVIARKAQIEADIKTLEELNLTGLENRNGEYPLRFDIVQV